MKDYSSWLQEVKGDYKQACCIVSLRTFNIHHEGKTALKKHMNSDYHKKCMKSFGNNKLITCTSSFASEAQEISAIEGIFVYHGVRHGHSYASQQCNINLVKDLFDSPSTVAKYLSCARRKSRAVTCNVLAP
jgi:hypothetical protein